MAEGPLRAHQGPSNKGRSKGQVEGHLALVTVNRPDVMNALNSEVLSELDEVVADLEALATEYATLTDEQINNRIINSPTQGIIDL